MHKYTIFNIANNYALHNTLCNSRFLALNVAYLADIEYFMRQYDCYVKLTLSNGYVFDATYKAHVTGIPCEADWTVADQDWKLVTCSDEGRYLKIAAGKTGGVLSHPFRVPQATAIDPYIAASGIGTDSRKLYVAVVNEGATSVVTSGTSQEPSYASGGSAKPDSTPYEQWTASSLSVSNGQRLSVAVYGGKFGIAYAGQLYKVKVNYKITD